MPENVAIQLLPKDHVERRVHEYRYRVASKFAFGNTVYAACGWGYGSAMLARCTDVTKVVGCDQDETALWHARKLYPARDFDPRS